MICTEADHKPFSIGKDTLPFSPVYEMTSMQLPWRHPHSRIEIHCTALIDHFTRPGVLRGPAISEDLVTAKIDR